MRFVVVKIVWNISGAKVESGIEMDSPSSDPAIQPEVTDLLNDLLNLTKWSAQYNCLYLEHTYRIRIVITQSLVYHHKKPKPP